VAAVAFRRRLCHPSPAVAEQATAQTRLEACVHQARDYMGRKQPASIAAAGH